MEPVAFVAGKWHRLRHPTLASTVRERNSVAAKTLEHGCKESTANPAELTALVAAAGRAAPGPRMESFPGVPAALNQLPFA